MIYRQSGCFIDGIVFVNVAIWLIVCLLLRCKYRSSFAMISFICAIPQEPDDKAFMLSLYDSYYKLMYSIAYKYVSDIQTVDDIVQDSIVSLYGKIDIIICKHPAVSFRHMYNF